MASASATSRARPKNSELGAAFLCAKLGIEANPRVDHAKYLVSWIKLLKDDRRAFTTAPARRRKPETTCLGFPSHDEAS
ncbi:hypothetical protein EN935_32135 [Mesorhizobium sp. M7D.F.Ca.US.004.03.1.1]|nr:hypothetical protein EN935_32135 [Mesorhizobium sp. M7D.F.Ca.US.004.03.1.1]